MNSQEILNSRFNLYLKGVQISNGFIFSNYRIITQKIINGIIYHINSLFNFGISIPDSVIKTSATTFSPDINTHISEHEHKTILSRGGVFWRQFRI